MIETLLLVLVLAILFPLLLRTALLVAALVVCLLLARAFGNAAEGAREYALFACTSYPGYEEVCLYASGPFPTLDACEAINPYPRRGAARDYTVCRHRETEIWRDR